MPRILDGPPSPVNSGRFAVRPEVAPEQPHPARRRERSSKRRNRTPIEASFDQLQANSRLSSDAKVVASQLALYCLADLNVSPFPGTLELGEFCGWGHYADGGKERVLNALAELDREGYTARLTRNQFWAWYLDEGRPKFGIIKPRPKYPCRRFILLLWKFLGDLPNLSPYLETTAVKVAPVPPPEKFEGGTGATLKVAPVPPSKVAPATLTMNRSKVEPLKVEENNKETTTTPRTHTREGDGGADRSSSSLSKVSQGKPEKARERPTSEPVDSPAVTSSAALGPAKASQPAAGEPQTLAVALPLDRAMERTRASQPAVVEPRRPSRADDPPGDDSQGEPTASLDEPARLALIDKVKEIAPGPDNQSVRQAIYDAVPDMVKRLKRAGSPSPYDHARMAIEKSAANPKRRDTIESLARGTVRNQIEEGLPAITAPEPPGKPKPAPDPEAERRDAVERRRVEVEAGARDDARKVRWDDLPEPDKNAIRADVDRDHPELAAIPVESMRNLARLTACLEWMDDRADTPPTSAATEAPPVELIEALPVEALDRVEPVEAPAVELASTLASRMNASAVDREKAVEAARVRDLEWLDARKRAGRVEPSAATQAPPRDPMPSLPEVRPVEVPARCGIFGPLGNYVRQLATAGGLL